MAPTSSSCRGLVVYGHLEGPSGPMDPTTLPQVTVGRNSRLSLMFEVDAKKHERGEGGKGEDL